MVGQEALALIGDHREEVRPAWDPASSVLWHGFRGMVGDAHPTQTGVKKIVRDTSGFNGRHGREEDQRPEGSEVREEMGTPPPETQCSGPCSPGHC